MAPAILWPARVLRPPRPDMARSDRLAPAAPTARALNPAPSACLARAPLVAPAAAWPAPR